MQINANQSTSKIRNKKKTGKNKIDHHTHKTRPTKKNRKKKVEKKGGETNQDEFAITLNQGTGVLFFSPFLLEFTYAAVHGQTPQGCDTVGYYPQGL